MKRTIAVIAIALSAGATCFAQTPAKVVIQSVDEKSGQPFFESQVPPEFGVVKSASLTCGSTRTFVFRWEKYGLAFGSTVDYKGYRAEASDFEGFLAWHYDQNIDPKTGHTREGKLFWNSGSRKDDKNAVLCVDGAALHDIVIGDAYVNYFHITKVTVSEWVQTKHGIFHSDVAVEGFNDTDAYSLTCGSTIVLMDTGGAQMFWCPIPETGEEYSVNILGAGSRPGSYYQQDNTVKFLPNQKPTARISSGVPELSGTIKFVLDQAEKIENDYTIVSVHPVESSPCRTDGGACAPLR